jgi:hypothetical protein
MQPINSIPPRYVFGDLVTQARLDLQVDFQSREVTAIANPRTSFQLGTFMCHVCTPAVPLRRYTSSCIQ